MQNKRCLLFLFLLFTIFGFLFTLQNKKEEDRVITIIKNKKNTMIAINYPQTKYPILNKEIKKYIDSLYEEFEDYDSFLHLKGKAELNIDYSYFITKEDYVNITLYSYMNSSLLQKPITGVKTFTYNPHTTKFMHLLELSKDENIVKEEIGALFARKYPTIYPGFIAEEDVKEMQFSIEKEHVTVYIQNEQTSGEYLSLSIPLTYFKIEEKEIEQTAFHYTPKSKTIDPTKKVIALTFDDGPSKYTSSLLKVLKKYDINATFFILGNKVSLYEDTLKKVIEDGNEIGNHSYNHKLMSTLSQKEIQDQINKTQNIIKEKLNYTPTCFRPTYGSINDKLRKSTSMHITLWNVDTLDWKLKDPKKIASRGIKVKDGSVILMHDLNARTKKALEIMIPKLLEEGYQFVTISEMEEVKLLRKKL